MNIAILGLGVVGLGVYDIIQRDFPEHHIKYVMELDPKKVEGLHTKWTDDLSVILKDPDVDVVVELIGGKGVAYRFVKAALEAKKHVVTANKALISEHFEEFTKLANHSGVTLAYEASVGGAINLLDPLKTIAKINHIHKIEGIINGSTNFILSKIFLEDYSLENALFEAKELGYIETGSNDDLEGWDLLRKINILSMISYHQFISETDILRVGLDTIPAEFFDYVKAKGLSMKYLATSLWENNEIMIHLEPVILSSNHFYNQINYEENIITIYGAYHKKQSFIGQGAGRYPTASAVVFDILRIQNKDYEKQSLPNNFFVNKNLKTYRFLVYRNNRFEVVENLTFDQLSKEKEILAFARIDDGAYENI